MKVAIYARCSTKKQDLESQLKNLHSWAKKNNYKATEYVDFAVSGRKDQRKGINALLEAARNKEFSYVGVLELSRIGRSMKFMHGVIEELSDLGIKIVLTNSNTVLDKDSIEGSALIGAFAMAADIEWRLIQERNARGRQAIRERGIKVGRKKKEVSMQAIKALQSQGLSLRQIGKELNVSGPTILRRIRSLDCE